VAAPITAVACMQGRVPLLRGDTICFSVMAFLQCARSMEANVLALRTELEGLESTFPSIAMSSRGLALLSRLQVLRQRIHHQDAHTGVPHVRMNWTCRHSRSRANAVVPRCAARLSSSAQRSAPSSRKYTRVTMATKHQRSLTRGNGDCTFATRFHV
jgi:hypothetical protein